MKSLFKFSTIALLVALIAPAAFGQVNTKKLSDLDNAATIADTDEFLKCDAAYTTCEAAALSLIRSEVLDAGAGNNLTMVLGDAAGVTAFSIQDSGSVEVANLNSNGVLTVGIGALGGNNALVVNSGVVHVADIIFAGGTNTGPLRLYGGGWTATPAKLELYGRQNNGRFVLEGSTNNTDNAAGTSTIRGSQAAASATTNITGGPITITGGSGASSSSGLAHGGAISLTGGTGYGTGNGGAVTISGGTANGSGSQGNVTITGGRVSYPHFLEYAISDEVTALTTGTAKLTLRMPYAFTLTEVRCNVNTAPTDATLNVDVNEGGVSVFSTVLTIDSTEKTSTTAATAAVISDSSLADDAEITFDIDQVGSTVAGAGLKCKLYGSQT